MRVLRPNSVSTGCTDRQLLLTPQSPQPSQTASLMTTRVRPDGQRAALAQPARLGGAALVVDQHGDALDVAASDALGLVEPVAVPQRRRRRQRVEAPGSARGSSAHTMICATPSASSFAVERGTSSPPAASCPPVIATARL